MKLIEKHITGTRYPVIIVKKSHIDAVSQSIKHHEKNSQGLARPQFQHMVN